LLGHSVVVSGVNNGGGAEEAVALGCSWRGGAQLPQQKYFMTNEYRSKYDKV